MILNSPFAKLVAFSALAILSIACKNTDNNTVVVTPDPPIQLVSTLSGAGEKPTSATSAATGTFVGKLDRASRVLSYTLTYSGLTPTAGHLHRVTAANGTGGVDVPFASLASPIIGTTTISTVGKVDSLINGFYYANLHTTAYPGGEIRGNLRVSGPVRLNATINGTSEKPTSNTSAAAGTFAGVIDPATRVLSYTVTYSGLTPTAGHLHRVTAANGTGGVEIPFASLVSPIIGTATLATDRRVDSLFNGFYYANLHTTAFPAGEIRGDIK
ncbi:CHRD domain-containing protein [Fibrella forsythiae]|uniref:CHRD domain-containing protein n=1 Tax=Fibrella forsythiae TaxID=2817061 RepID=A0ABS3JC78_9BACT|nr:CHRD domain-containing protein [Fibrella forsythiae]MBO0947587.1 CHRD domain-containing protein [Fibrella forsythiae]